MTHLFKTLEKNLLTQTIDTLKIGSVIKIGFVIFSFLILSLGLLQSSNFGQISASAQTIDSLDILKIDCLFPGAPKGDGTKCPPPGKLDKSLVANVVNFLKSAAYPLAILVIIWGGYQYFIGGIDGKSSGQKAIQGAVIGLFVIALADFITQSIFGGGTSAPAIITTGSNGQVTFNPAGIIALADTVRTILVSLAGIVAVLVIIWGGYKYFFSGLDIEKEGGAKALRNGVVGLVVVFLANGLFGYFTDFSKSVADGDTSNATITLLGKTLLTPILGDITNFLTFIASAVAILVISYGGYKYFFSGLDGTKEDGLKNIRSGVIGLVAILFARGIVGIIERALPVTDSDNTPPGLNINTQPIVEFFQTIVGGLIIPTSTALAVFFLIIAAYNWITSNGDQKKIETAQKGLRNAVIGLIILLVSATIVQLVVFVFTNPSLDFGG